MRIIKNARDLLKAKKEETRLIIYGGGAYGSELRCELELLEFRDYYICDSDESVGRYTDHFISRNMLSDLATRFSVTVVIAVKSDRAVREISEQITCMCHGQDMDQILFRYVPESRQELIERHKDQGIFNGITYKKTLNDGDAVCALGKMITGSTPFLFARWGTIEGDVVYKMKIGVEPLPADYAALRQNAGVFPITEEVISEYCGIMEKAALEIDMLCVFYWQAHLDKWVEWFSPKAVLVSSALEYPFFSDSWTKFLIGLKVLVVHPFSQLIAEQYKKRDKLFANQDVLPELDLITYQAVQSMGGNTEYVDWIEALEKMKRDISEIDFDIALIGCGAYGMPLGAFIKSKLHKKAIHMGGTLQILFGIKGKRWESESYGYQHKLYNQYWVRPTDDLKPKGYEKVENGCYW